MWATDEQGFSEALECYFAGVSVRESWVLGEGAVQAIWTRVRDPWTPFDREAVLGYKDGVAQTSGRAFSQVQTARDEIQRLPVKRAWARMPIGKVAAELDQLAVDPNGRLVLIELKDAGAEASSVYYSPLQLLQYVHEWAAAFDGVRDSLCALIEARKELGLSPSDMPDLGRGLRPVVCFGRDLRSPEVRTRFELVRTIANRHLPDGAGPIEAWAIDGSTPVQLG